MTVAYILGSIYGALMGSKPGSRLEKYGVVLPTIIGATPEFFIGIIVIIIFSHTLGLFPSGGIASQATYQQIAESESWFSVYLTGDFWYHYTLPFLAVVLKYLYYPSLIMRGSVVEVRDQEFNYYHRIKGIGSRRRFRHLIKHASLPVITLYPVSMVRALSGLVLIEVVFNWPGIGKLLIDSVLQRDVPVIQFVFILIAIWIILGNYIVDILYGVIDPRIALDSES